VHTFTVAAGIISGANEIAIPVFTISNTERTMVLYSIYSSCRIETLTNGATGILNIGGTSAITGLTATAVGNTVNYRHNPNN